MEGAATVSDAMVVALRAVEVWVAAAREAEARAVVVTGARQAVAGA